tara:strand:+ start:354 stop:476 length:123 start_codon:yes stop_codon:yes gene_type:complete
MNYYTKKRKQKEEIKSALWILAAGVPLVMFAYIVQLTLIN